MTRSISDLNAITLEIDSVNSSPGIGRVCAINILFVDKFLIVLFKQKFPEQEITFSTFKDILINSHNEKILDSKRRMNMLKQFRNDKFEDLVDNYKTSVKPYAIQR